MHFWAWENHEVKTKGVDKYGKEQTVTRTEKRAIPEWNGRRSWSENYRGTHFAPWEWEPMQYMTMVQAQDGVTSEMEKGKEQERNLVLEGARDKETALTRGCWEDEILERKERWERWEMRYGQSQRQRRSGSGSGTPVPTGQSTPMVREGSGGGNGSVRPKTGWRDYLKKPKAGDTPVKAPTNPAAADTQKTKTDDATLSAKPVVANGHQATPSKPQTLPSKPEGLSSKPSTTVPSRGPLPNGHHISSQKPNAPAQGHTNGTANVLPKAQPLLTVTAPSTEPEDAKSASKDSSFEITEADFEMPDAPSDKVSPSKAKTEVKAEPKTSPVKHKLDVENRNPPSAEKRQKVEPTSTLSSQALPKRQPYTGTARPHKGGPSGGSNSLKSSQDPKVAPMPKMLSPLHGMPAAGGEPMKKSASNDSRQGGVAMKKSDFRDSRDGRRGISPTPSSLAKKEAPAPAVKKPIWDKTSTPASKPLSQSSKPKVEKRPEPATKSTPKPAPMPPLFNGDLPPNILEALAADLELGVVAPDAEPAVNKIIGRAKREQRDLAAIDTPPASTNRKLTTTEARIKEVREQDTPGVTRRAAAPEKKVKINLRVSESREATPATAPRKVAVLKYGKPRAKNVTRILQMKPIPDRHLDDVAQRMGAGKTPAKGTATGQKGVAKRITPAQKRQRERERTLELEAEERSAKKPKPSALSEEFEPLTPQKQVETPRLGPPSAKRDKEKGVDTPSSASVSQTPRAEPISSPVAARPLPTATREEIARLKADSERYISLGRTLKHESDAVYKASLPSLPSLDDVKKAQAMAVQSCLAYIVGFNLQEERERLLKVDRGRRGEGWKDFFPYLVQVQTNLRKGSRDSEDQAKTRVILDLIVCVVGMAATRAAGACLAEREGGEELARDLRDVGGKRELFMKGFEHRSDEVESKWAYLVKADRALAWTTTNGVMRGVDKVQSRLSACLKEWCADNKVEWDRRIDF